LIGSGKLTRLQALLEASEIKGKIPKLDIELKVKECYFGCNQVFLDSDPWDQSAFADRSSLPSLGKMVSDQLLSANKMPA